MAVSQASRFTAKEYLALEAVAETRHEFYGGAIVGMAGAELGHNQIADNVRAELRNALADRSCRILGSDQRVYVEAKGEYFYPDVLVVCAEPVLVDPKPRSLVNPEVIVEVLSDSTERTDRGDKWSAYREIASLTDYVMLASTECELEHYHRLPDGTWSLRVVREAGAVTLASGVVLDLERLYRLVPGF
jgi:Uma2 family endonuclease